MSMQSCLAKSTYCHAAGFELAKMMKLAYQDGADDQFKALGAERVVFFPSQNAKKIETQGYIVSDESSVVVVFRGTERKFRDWLTDANTFRKPFQPQVAKSTGVF